MTPTKRRPDRRDQILREATTLFAGGGFEGTSVRVIARACGITEAAIYRHFESKVDLYREVISAKAHQHDIEGYLAAQEGRGDIEAVLTRIAEHVLGLAAGDPELMRLMFANSVDSNDVATALFREVRLPYITFLTGELQRLMDAGEVRKVDPFITSRCFVGMVMDCALNVNVWEEITSVEFQANDVVCNNVPIFARGLSMPAGAPTTN
ncbi:MAG: TetR/AcrR family transcriptional regulator [bacterium]|nr:TetR/AcrR family transcriptional regulator [bacterium]